IDRNVTGAGARLLAQRLASPSTDPAVITGRLAAIAWMLADSGRRRAIRDELARAPDPARSLARLTLNRGGPRDPAPVAAGRQTLPNAFRSSTTELGDLEAKIAGAADRALAIELAVFDELTAAVVAAADPVRAIADALAVVDVGAGFAVLAEAESYCRPVVES